MAARRRMMRARRKGAAERLIVVRFLGLERGPKAPCQELAKTIKFEVNKNVYSDSAALWPLVAPGVATAAFVPQLRR